MGPKKLVIDCDAGTDDAQAIMIALAHQDKAEIVAITTVFGNATAEDTTKNVLRLLNFYKRTEIPVYKGCISNLVGEPCVANGYHGWDGFGDVSQLYPQSTTNLKADHAVNHLIQLADKNKVYPGCCTSMNGTPSLESGYHGFDGFGDVKDKYPPGGCQPHQEKASCALVRMASERKGEITLVALGPLTNLATAHKLDPNFFKNLKEVYIMGGNTTGRGNVTPTAEFNFFSDPEAAQYVLNQAEKPTYLVPLELCEDTSFDWDWYERFISIPTDRARFVKDIDKVMVEGAKRDGLPKYWTWDQLALSVALDESIILATQNVVATVEVRGQFTRGQAVVNWRNPEKKPENITLVTEIDNDKYEKMILSAVQ